MKVSKIHFLQKVLGEHEITRKIKLTCVLHVYSLIWHLIKSNVNLKIVSFCDVKLIKFSKHKSQLFHKVSPKLE